MTRYGIAVDTARCMACYNCFMACKDEHCGFDNMPVARAQPETGQFWINLKETERGNDSRKIKVLTVPTFCSHCAEPVCARDAPQGAVYIREDGIVIIDPVKAKGQKQIVAACPTGTIFWNEDLKIPQKCTMCAHLLDKGYKQPRCVEVCPNQALIFGDLDDDKSEISRKIVCNKVTPLAALEGIKTNVVHLNIPTVFLAGTVYLPDDEVAIGVKVQLRSKKGKIYETTTNYFGDWEVENLEKGEAYDISIDLAGFETIKLIAIADSDKYVGESLMTPRK